MDNKNDSLNETKEPQGPSYLWVGVKFLVAVALFTAGMQQWSTATADEDGVATHRRLMEAAAAAPLYMEPLLKELEERKKLFAESEVIKYWFEYTGPLQVRYQKMTLSYDLERTIFGQMHSSS